MPSLKAFRRMAGLMAIRFLVWILPKEVRQRTSWLLAKRLARWGGEPGNTMRVYHLAVPLWLMWGRQPTRAECVALHEELKRQAEKCQA